MITTIVCNANALIIQHPRISTKSPPAPIIRSDSGDRIELWCPPRYPARAGAWPAYSRAGFGRVSAGKSQKRSSGVRARGICAGAHGTAAGEGPIACIWPGNHSTTALCAANAYRDVRAGSSSVFGWPRGWAGANDSPLRSGDSTSSVLRA